MYNTPLLFPTRIDYPDQPLHPVPSQSSPAPDLRHALLQLQVLTRNSCSQGEHEPSHDELVAKVADWSNGLYQQPGTSLSTNAGLLNASTDATLLQRLWKFMDDISLSDCLEQRDGDAFEVRCPGARSEENLTLDYVIQVFLNDHYETIDDTELEVSSKVRADDTLGHQTLRKPRYRDNSSVVPTYSYEDQIVVEIAERSRFANINPTEQNTAPSSAPPKPTEETVAASDSPYPFRDYFSTTRLFADRASFQSQTLQFMEIFLTLSSPLFPRPAIFLEYVPWVTAMVRADDEEELNERTRFETLQIAASAAVSTTGAGDGGDTFGTGLGRLRMTRNSMKGVVLPGGMTMGRWRPGEKFVRYLDDLNKEQLELARKSALTWSD